MVEFALVLPLLIALFALSYEVMSMVLVHQKMNKAAFTLGDLVTQLKVESGVCTFIESNVVPVANGIMRPYDFEGGNFGMVVTSVLKIKTGGAEKNMIEWQYKKKLNGNAPSVGTNGSTAYKTQAKLPAVLGNNSVLGERIIVTEMFYRYKGFLSMFLGTTGKTMAKGNGVLFSKQVFHMARTVQGDGKDEAGKGLLSGC